MKTVFSSHLEVCHVWASMSQEHGRAGNITFNGDTIFSYGYWPMARFLEDKKIVLIRNWAYSNSTAKHLNYVRRAIPGEYEQIYVYNPASGYSGENVRDLVSKIKESYDKFQTARKYKKYYQEHEQEARNQLKRYCRLFKCEYPGKEIKKYSLNTESANLAVQAQQKRFDELEATREVKYQKRLAEIEPEIRKALNDWLSGESDQVSAYDKVLKKSIHISEGVVLRIKDFDVQTSMGARVPIPDAQRIWKFIQAGKSIKGLQIGHYTITSFNGELKVGCHKISSSEVNRIGAELDKI